MKHDELRVSLAQNLPGLTQSTVRLRINQSVSTPGPGPDDPSGSNKLIMPLPGSKPSAVECEKLQNALRECHRRIPAGLGRDTACRHLNLGLAKCLVSLACPEEAEAVLSLCTSGGTALKRSQCQQAQLSLAVCLGSLQQ